MPQSLLMEFLSFLPEPTPSSSASSTLPPGYTPAQIDKVGASGYDLENLEGYNTTPDKTIDKNLNTRWANYGVGYFIQYEHKSSDPISGDAICGIDISWYRGDVRAYDFIVSTSQDGIKFDNVFFSKSSGTTNSLERYLIPDFPLQAKHVRITVNGNTENLWAGITEVQILSRSTCPCPPTTQPTIQPTTPPVVSPIIIPPTTPPTTECPCPPTTPPTTGNENIPSAQSVYDTGTMALPSTVKGVIISIPDEGHHPISDEVTISLKNPSYLPTNLVVPTGTSITFVHGDPGHVHEATVADSNSGTVAWQTTAVKHPGGSDVKVLPAGNYDVTDEEYPDMKCFVA